MDVEKILEKTDLVRLAERAGARMRRSGNGWRGCVGYLSHPLNLAEKIGVG